jgi:hypothetical protein
VKSPAEFLEAFFVFLSTFLEPKKPRLPPPKPTEEEAMIELVDGWPEFDGPLKSIPKGRKGMVEVYGDPSVTYTSKGTAKVSREFARKLHTVPADMLPGLSRRLYMHRAVSPYFREALRRAQLVAPDYKFERVGCFNPRHMRHDKSRPLSDHTWAVAFDINSSKNRARYRKPTDPEPFEPGWEKYSDLPEAVVLAFKSVGFQWGGDWGLGKRGGFSDPMHFSLRR